MNREAVRSAAEKAHLFASDFYGLASDKQLKSSSLALIKALVRMRRPERPCGNPRCAVGFFLPARTNQRYCNVNCRTQAHYVKRLDESSAGDVR